MQRKISDIRAELQGIKARENYTPEQLRKFYRKSAWRRGVCDYAEWLFDDYLDRRDLLGVDEGIVRIGKSPRKICSTERRAGSSTAAAVVPLFMTRTSVKRCSVRKTRSVPRTVRSLPTITRIGSTFRRERSKRRQKRFWQP